MTVTIKDVAKHAGVSISTVSRVLNNNYPVKPEIRERVERAVLECGYKVNALAGALRSSNSKLIVVAIPGVINTLYMELVKGVQKVADEKDYTLVIVDTGENDEKERKVLESLLKWHIKGLIIAPCSPTPDVLYAMERSDVNVVVVDRDVSSFIETDRVVWENYYAARDLTRHLIEMGHEKIGLICAQNRFSVGFDRMNGYLDELIENGITPKKEYYDNRNFSLEEACETAKRMMQSADPPTAYIGISYYGAKAVMKAATDLGLKIPDDISLASFSNMELNDYYIPKVTNIEEDLCAMGERAAKILFDRIEHGEKEEKESVVMTSTLTLRDSVKNITQG